MARIVLTHGRGLRARDEKKLERKFVRHMRTGLENIGYTSLDDHDVSFIYYGNVLERMDPSPEPASSPVAEFPFSFDPDVETLNEQLTTAASADPRICTIMEERAERAPIDSAASDEAARRAASTSAIDDRTSRLTGNPGELRSVLEDRLGAELDNDDIVRDEIRRLGSQIAENPREVARRQSIAEVGEEDADRMDTLLRTWMVDPAMDVVAGLRALRKTLQVHGVDLRSHLSEWQRGTVEEILVRFEGTDFGKQWATLFDIVAVITNNSMLDGLYIARWMKDVENYFRDATTRDAVRGLFRDVLANHDEPTILVAHSLGSVIAYDTLREYPELDVSGLVTIGSPLSIDHFRRSLARTDEKAGNLPVPSMLAKWVNVYSELDPLALGSGIQRYFKGGGPDGHGPVDREAENTGYMDAHNPDQYLRSNVTARAIVAMIAQATVREGFRDRG
jgi:pimeloyl-ACP methyl ester carboxylesterase